MARTGRHSEWRGKAGAAGVAVGRTPGRQEADHPSIVYRRAALRLAPAAGQDASPAVPFGSIGFGEEHGRAGLEEELGAVVLGKDQVGGRPRTQRAGAADSPGVPEATAAKQEF